MSVHLVCRDHGFLYHDSTSGPGDLIQSSLLVPQRRDIPKPKPGDVIHCPLCHGGLDFVYLRPASIR